MLTSAGDALPDAINADEVDFKIARANLCLSLVQGMQRRERKDNFSLVLLRQRAIKITFSSTGSQPDTHSNFRDGCIDLRRMKMRLDPRRMPDPTGKASSSNHQQERWCLFFPQILTLSKERR